MSLLYRPSYRIFSIVMKPTRQQIANLLREIRSLDRIAKLPVAERRAYAYLAAKNVLASRGYIYR